MVGRVFFALVAIASAQYHTFGESDLAAAPEEMGMAPEHAIAYPQLSPQALSQLYPSQLQGVDSSPLNTEANAASNFPNAAIPHLVDPYNGLPQLSAQSALSQFLADEKAEQEREAFLSAQHAQTREGGQVLDLEEISPGSGDIGAAFTPHTAVPKLQKWLAAMDPMSYASPTYSNPVAKHFFDQIADPKLPPDQRERLQRLVSSPYMFQMLGNPAYADPQLWTGLVSGAAVPYPLRTAIMSQRTTLPFRIANTGDAMSVKDYVAMNEFKKEAEKSGVAGSIPNIGSHIRARKRLNRIFSALNNHERNEKSRTDPTPHSDPLRDFFDGTTHKQKAKTKDIESLV